MPPEELDWDPASLIATSVSRAAASALTELSKAEPNLQVVEERVSVLRRALRKLASLTGSTAEKAADGLGKAVGEEAGKSAFPIVTRVGLFLMRLLYNLVKHS